MKQQATEMDNAAACRRNARTQVPPCWQDRWGFFIEAHGSCAISSFTQRTSCKVCHLQVAIITGSGQGVGAAAAKLFAQHGAKLVVTDIDASKSEQVSLHIAGSRPKKSKLARSQHGRRLRQRSEKQAEKQSVCQEM